MRKGAPILIAAVLGLCFWFLLIRGCNKPGPDHTNDKRAVDSIVQKAISDSVKWGVQRDSIFKIVSILQKGKDSLSGVIKEYKVDIRDKGADIQGLIDELNRSEDAKDTLRALSACDSLKAQFTTAKALVLGYMVSNDSLASTNSHIISQKDTIITRLSGMFSEANGQLFEVSRKYSTLFSDYNRINVKPKRWGAGPQIGISLINGKVAPTIGVGLTYNLIRF